MEVIHKRKGFMKTKLVMTLYRAARPASSMPVSGKVNPDMISSNASVGLIVEGKSMAPAVAKHRMVETKKTVCDDGTTVEAVAHTTNVGDGAGEDNVDKRAALYISYVQERIRLQRNDSERRVR